MEGIPVYYVMQPSVDDTLNVFFLPSQYRSQADVKIQDVVNHFPHRNNGKFYHFRFYAICDKDQKTWVDISNLTAKAPVVENRILVKILELAQPQHTKIFASVYGASASQPNIQRPQEQAPQRPNPPQQQQQQQQQAPPQNRAPQNQQQQQQQRPTPQKPANPQPQSPPQTSASDYNLLDDHVVVSPSKPTNFMPQQQSTTTGFMAQSQNNTPFMGQAQNQAPPRQDNSHTQGMTRDQLSAYKAQQKEDAIQEKLDFFKKVRDDEEKSQNEKERAYVEVEDIIKKWAGKDKQRNNIRALLCTLQDVVWVESGWTALSFSDLMQPAQIKKNYFKAITRFHPDKNQTADYKHKYIAERVTNELNAAWDEFRKTNP